MLINKSFRIYFRKYWYLYALGILALLMVDICDSVFPPQIIKYIVDGLVGEINTDLPFTLKFIFSEVPTDFTIVELTRCIVALIILACINFLCRILWRIGFFTASHAIGRDIRHKLFNKSLTFSQTFYSDNKVGGLMSYYINDVDSVSESFGWGALMVCDTLILLPLVMYQMFKESVIITLILLIPLLIICISSLIFGKALDDRYDKRQKAFEELSDYTQESISGIRVIKAFVKEAKELSDFSKKNKMNEKVNVDYLKLSIFFNTFIDIFIWLLYFAIVAIGVYLALTTKTVTPGSLTALVSYFDKILWPMFAIGEIVNIGSRAKASGRRLQELFDKESDLIESENPVSLDSCKGDIEFRHLSFRYSDSDHNQLSDISLKINSGEFIGIIGKTGSSKTTLVNLLLRLYNVNKGEIFIDGIDIMDLKISDVRKNIGYVPQDNFLYSTSIESNISFSSSFPDRERVKKEAMIAGVHKDISQFPEGYDTILGERGVSVSGGQKQRISIARALYKNANILILDDSLSAVDTKTEEEILEFLKKERKGKTTLLVAHRISSIKDADKIIVLDKGGILTGFGTHQELLKNNEIYKETYNLQKLEEEGGINHE